MAVMSDVFKGFLRNPAIDGVVVLLNALRGEHLARVTTVATELTRIAVAPMPREPQKA